MEWLIVVWFAVVVAGPIAADVKAKKEIKALKAHVADCQRAK